MRCPHVPRGGARGWARLDTTTRGHKGDPVSVKCVLIGIGKIGWTVLVGEGHRIPDPPQFTQFPQGPIGA